MRKHLSLVVLSILLISMMAFRGSTFVKAEAPVDDVGIASIVANTTVVYKGWAASINVTVFNNGTEPVNVGVTLQYNATGSVGSQTVAIDNGTSSTITFTWDTTGVSYHQNYTMNATATIAGDPSPGDNTLVEGNITVTTLGDINGDGVITGDDLIIVAWSFGAYGPDFFYSGSPMSSRWNPLGDITHSNCIDGSTLIAMAKNFGKSSVF
jgi:hypothetical protein